jgi:hypothetical protein
MKPTNIYPCDSVKTNEHLVYVKEVNENILRGFICGGERHGDKITINRSDVIELFPCNNVGGSGETSEELFNRKNEA